MRRSAVLLLLLLGAALGHCALVQFNSRLPAYDLDSTPPVTNWLLPPAGRAEGINELAWRKIGAKLWFFLSNLDHDFVDEDGNPVPPRLPGANVTRVSGVTCGRNARLWNRIVFHDCGPFDIGNSGSEGDTGKPRFGCNGSLRKELGPCLAGPGLCINGTERAIDPLTGRVLNESAFAAVEREWPGRVDWEQPENPPRFENIGFASAVAFYYQIKLEAESEPLSSPTRLEPSLADIMVYAGMLAVAKCGGPHILFQPGRVDAPVADAPFRLPEPTEPLSANVAYFAANGLTSFDMVNLLAAHSAACFSVGCLDATPNRLDPDWARLVLTVTSGDDERICQFGADGSAPQDVQRICVLPSDAELAARADTRCFLAALTSNSSADIAACARDPRSPFNPVGSCRQPNTGSNCTARPAAWVPFRLIPRVNLCNRRDVVKVGCPTTTAQANFDNAVATSYFKLSKLFVENDDGTPVQHRRWGIMPQPCQPGLIKVGAEGEEEPNPLCSCCAEAQPQDFSFNPAEAAAVAPRSARQAGVPAPDLLDALPFDKP